jgi:hypothetical protein
VETRQNRRAVSEEKTGFIVRYRSARALRREHETSISKGGMLVPWKGAAPVSKSMITLRIESPDGTMFDIPARVGTAIKDRGFTVAIEVDPAQRGRTAIDLFMRGDRMKRLVEAEKSGGAPVEAEVLPLGANMKLEEATDPGGASGDEDVLSADTDTASFDAGRDERPGSSPFTPAAVRGALKAGNTDADEAGDVDHLDADTDYGGEDGEPPELADEEVEEVMPEGFRKPGPGEEYIVYVIKYSQVAEFAAIRDHFRATQRLEINYPEETGNVGKIAQVHLTLPGHNLFQMFGFIEKIGHGKLVIAFDENNEKFRLACNYVDSPSARARMKNEENLPKTPVMVTRLMEKVPEEDPEKMPIRRRLQRMGMDDKINMALSGGREERMALAMDGNKAVHHYLLRNAKISLDEIAFMARLPTMNPDVLDKIAENTGYTQNPSVVKALVYNPKTPVQTAIRLLDRLPRPEVMNLAKRMNMNLRLVMAAKKKLEGRRR